MPVLRRSRSPTPISRDPPSPSSRSVSSPGSSGSWTHEYDVHPDDSPLDGPLILGPPPVYQRLWPFVACKDAKVGRVPSRSPKFIIPVRKIISKMKTIIAAVDLNEATKAELKRLLSMRVRQRIQELLRVQNITNYMGFKDILVEYWRYFPQYTNKTLVEETFAYIKEKHNMGEIVDRDGPSSSLTAEDQQFVKQSTQQEIHMIFKDTPGINLFPTNKNEDVSLAEEPEPEETAESELSDLDSDDESEDDRKCRK